MNDTQATHRAIFTTDERLPPAPWREVGERAQREIARRSGALEAFDALIAAGPARQQGP